MPSRTIRLSTVQAVRKAGITSLFLILVALMGVSSTPTQAVHEVVETSGRVLLAICILGRCWCTLYIGGRKMHELVRIGPYSMVRNPLYTMSFIGAAGAGAQTGSVTMTLLFLITAWLVFRIVVAKEEAYLLGKFGEPYIEYLRTTPRFLPNPSLWRDQEWVEFRPDRLGRTLVDGLWFLAAIPLTEILEYLQQIGALPILFWLP